MARAFPRLGSLKVYQYDDIQKREITDGQCIFTRLRRITNALINNTQDSARTNLCRRANSGFGGLSWAQACHPEVVAGDRMACRPWRRPGSGFARCLFHSFGSPTTGLDKQRHDLGHGQTPPRSHCAQGHLPQRRRQIADCAENQLEPYQRGFDCSQQLVSVLMSTLVARHRLAYQPYYGCGYWVINCSLPPLIARSLSQLRMLSDAYLVRPRVPHPERQRRYVRGGGSPVGTESHLVGTARFSSADGR